MTKLLSRTATVARRSPFAFTAIVALLVAARCGADPGLFLSWGDCPLGMSAQDASSVCATNTGVHDLYCAIRPGAQVDSVLGVEIVVDVQLASTTTPSWWRVGADSCRDGGLVASGTFAGRDACRELWLQPPAGGVVSVTHGMPRGGANQLRLVIGLAQGTQQLSTLEADSLYYAARISLNQMKTMGAGACAGCDVPACLVLNSVRLRRPPRPLGAPSGDVLIETPGAPAAQATWQGGASCGAVPARRASWGAIKGLYR